MKKSKKIVLFFPKVSKTEILKMTPLSLLSILRLVPESKYDIKIFTELDGEDYMQKTLNNLDDKTLCFCISCMTGWQINDAVKISKLVKKYYPGIPIIWGGWHPSLLPEETLKETFVDIVVWGMGETTFPELINALEKKTSLNKVKGIYFKEKHKIIKTEPRPFEKLDDLPRLPYHLLNNTEKYIVNEEGYRALNYYSSYGCPYACSFCATCGIYNRRWNGLSSERVLDEIEDLVRKYKLTKILINDNNFYVNEKRIFEILKGLKDRNLNIKLGSTSGRAAILANYNKETWKLMSRYVTDILIGAESASQKTLERINKESDIIHTYKFAKLCKKYKIHSLYTLIIGFPFLNTKEKYKKEFVNMIKFIKKLMKIDKTSRFMLFLYTPYPGNKLFEYCKKKGYKEPKKLEEWSKMGLYSKTISWVPDEYAFLTEMIRGYSSPIMFEYNKVMKGKRFNFLYKIVFLVAYLVNKLRWETEFFRIPVDYIIFRKFMKPKLIESAKTNQLKKQK